MRWERKITSEAVSIHAPPNRKERRGPYWKNGAVRTSFQSTPLPTGRSDYKARTAKRVTQGVSIHAPPNRKERPSSGVFEGLTLKVSIHAPPNRKERPTGSVGCRGWSLVSIHAPPNRKERHARRRL